jgi:hypothetical protein
LPSPLARITTAALLFAAPVSAADFLPGVSLHLEAARYAPAEKDLHWMGWLGGGTDLVRARGATGYVRGDVETILGNTRRAFDATQANYHLELGARRRAGRVTVNPFFHHVSRHYSDREKAAAVDWNVLGARVAAAWAEGAVPVRVSFGLGHTTLASLVGYRWEATGDAEAELHRGRNASFYVGASGRFVSIDPDPALVRGSFLDASLEAGGRFAHGRRVLETYTAYEHRNDVFLEAPGARDRARIGFRIRFDESVD